MDAKKRKFNVYEVQTREGSELVATRYISNPVPPFGVLRTLGLVSGVTTEADAVRVAKRVDEAKFFC